MYKENLFISISLQQNIHLVTQSLQCTHTSIPSLQVCRETIHLIFTINFKHIALFVTSPDQKEKRFKLIDCYV